MSHRMSAPRLLAAALRIHPDVRKADPKGFRGLPHISAAPCADGCEACRDVCSTSAIAP